MSLEASTSTVATAERSPGLLWALYAAVFMVNLDARVVAPLLPTLADELHVSIARAAWLVSAYMLPYGLFQLAFGPLADRYGKIPVCIYAMSAFSLGTACCSLWPSFTAMLTLRALTGAAAAGLIPLTLAYIGDTVPYARRQAAIATLMASAGAAQAFSTMAGGTIATVFSWRAVFPMLGALSGAATLALYTLRTQEVRAPRGAKVDYLTVLRAPLMRPLLGLASAEGFLYMGAFSYLSGLLEQRFGLNALAIGLVLGTAGISQLLAARILPRVLGRVSERRLMSAGAASLAIAYLASAFAPHWAVIVFACALLGAGFIACHTTLQTRVTEIFPGARGTAVALFAFSLFLGSGVGTVAIGSTLERCGYTITFTICGGLLLVFRQVLVSVLG
jgi:predicted MFS family arabinose efflux permease